MDNIEKAYMSDLIKNGHMELVSEVPLLVPLGDMWLYEGKQYVLKRNYHTESVWTMIKALDRLKVHR